MDDISRTMKERGLNFVDAVEVLARERGLDRVPRLPSSAVELSLAASHRQHLPQRVEDLERKVAALIEHVENLEDEIDVLRRELAEASGAG